MGFCLLQNMGKNLGKVKRENLRSKHNHKPLAHAKQSTADAFKTASIRAIQKLSEATGDSICNKSLKKTHESQEVRQRIVRKQLKVKQEI